MHQLATPKHRQEDIDAVMSCMPCKHNNWDNVRVVRGLMTLRCRVCQLQWRAPVGMVWEALYCVYYRTQGGCKKGRQCCRLHINGRKLSEAARERRKTTGARRAEPTCCAEPVPPMMHTVCPVQTIVPTRGRQMAIATASKRSTSCQPSQSDDDMLAGRRSFSADSFSHHSSRCQEDRTGGSQRSASVNSTSRNTECSDIEVSVVLVSDISPEDASPISAGTPSCGVPFDGARKYYTNDPYKW
eukprot:TRINITY_DN427_c0_g1_i1.p1 TRINITY_DN427_c0_g1~~TRINITY_DN427_c0_g1_i1.p1  ORF type:complete len:276 (+),score=50.29 TRINITY_DN427_c0_g1_i1:101-829(+)